MLTGRKRSKLTKVPGPLLLMLTLLLMLLLPGCTGNDVDPGTVTPPLVESTFEDIQTAIFEPSCVLACHDQFVAMGGLDLSGTTTSYRELVQVPSAWDPERILVVPGAPESSVLMMTLGERQGAPKMPPGGIEPLPTDQIQMISDWIERGAPRPEEEQ